MSRESSGEFVVVETPSPIATEIQALETQFGGRLRQDIRATSYIYNARREAVRAEYEKQMNIVNEREYAHQQAILQCHRDLLIQPRSWWHLWWSV